jgi:hypothetical protein
LAPPTSGPGKEDNIVDNDEDTVEYWRHHSENARKMGFLHAADGYAKIADRMEAEEVAVGQEEAAATYPVSKSVLIKNINEFRMQEDNRAAVTQTLQTEDTLYNFLISQGWTPPTI